MRRGWGVVLLIYATLPNLKIVVAAGERERERSSRKREPSEYCTKLTRTTPNEEPTSTEATLCSVLG